MGKWREKLKGKGGGFLIALMAALLISLAVAIPYTLKHNLYRQSPASDLSIVLLIGVAFLLVALGLMAVLFSTLDLADSRYALGLPEGSVRAVIALTLILLFFIASIFLVFETRTSAERTLKGVTRSELAQMRNEGQQVIGQRPEAGTDPETFTVDIRYDSGFNSDLAKQLLTLIGTLVVAVSAFYFGANSVAAAQGLQPPAGEALAAKVRGMLSGNAFSDVTVSVAGRTAVLTGTVGSEALKTEVDKAAKSIVGIEDVHNELTVQAQQAVDVTTGQQAVDDTTGQQAVDDTTGQQAVDDTTGQQAVDDTTGQQA